MIIIIVVIITIISWLLCKRLRGRLVSGRHGGRSRFSRSRPFVSPFEALFVFFAISLLVYQLFRQMTAIAFDLAAWRLSLQQGSSSLLCLWLPLASEILVLSNTTSPESCCMALQELVSRYSLWDTALLNFLSIPAVFSLPQALTPALTLWHRTVGVLYPSATPMYVGC